MSEKRKQALVAYLAALFGVAFILVLVSLIIQVNKQGTANTTYADRIVALQTQVQDLVDQKNDLNDSIEELEESIAQYEVIIEEMEAAAESNTQQITDLENQVQALAYLTAAQDALAKEDPDAVNEAMENLAEYSQYLTEDALEIYNAMVEQVTVTEE